MALSIIDEAMKKSQQSPIPNRFKLAITKKSGSKTLARMIGLLPIVILLGIGILLIFIPQAPPPVKKVIAKPIQNIPKKKISIEGVFISEGNKIAYINNQALRLGDQLNGMKIIAIGLDSIMLQQQNGNIELRTGSTYLL